MNSENNSQKPFDFFENTPQPDEPQPAPGGGRYAFNPGVVPPAAPAAPALPKEKLLFRLGLVIGIGFLLHLLFRNVFVVLLQAGTPLGDMYFGSTEGEIIVNLLYSYFVVGLPFLIVWLVLRRQKQLSYRIPLGGVYQKQNAVLLLFVGIAFCFLGDLAANYFAAFAESMGVVFHSYRQALEGDAVPQSAAGLLLYVVQGALVPAFIEEFVFRGVILQPLRKFGDWFAIFTSALLFGLMHGNMTQVPFAIIAGVALGYCATVTGSLWVGVAVHFFNNLFAVCSSVISDRYNDGVTILFSNVCIYGFLAVGLLALVLYVTRNHAWRRLYPGTYAGTPKRHFFLAPTLVLAGILMICLTLSDIPALTDLFSWI